MAFEKLLHRAKSASENKNLNSIRGALPTYTYLQTKFRNIWL